MNPLNGFVLGFDIEPARSPNRNPPRVSPNFLAARDNRFHHVTRLKVVYPAALLGSSAGKTIFVYAAHLPTLPTHSDNGQWLQGGMHKNLCATHRSVRGWSVTNTHLSVCFEIVHLKPECLYIHL